MNWDRAFTGGCSCGRNQFAIVRPADVGPEKAEVYFDAGSDNRRTQAAPLTTWLRVPLDWYQSFTRSFFPDETHNAIRRTFVPLHAPSCKRNFCGFCGTPLTYWSEDPPEEAEYISVTIGSLSPEDQAALEDLDLLPTEEDVEAIKSPTPTSSVVPASSSSPQATARSPPQPSVTHRSGTTAGIPWFEEMIEGSRLGQHGRRRQGRGGTADSSVQVQWEVSEWYGSNRGESAMNTGGLLDSGTVRSPAKRKSPEVGGQYTRPSRLSTPFRSCSEQDQGGSFRLAAVAN